ncbi:hypothetical protein [Occultella gossypii]|uniref:Glycine zipper domain-containing protein n=1 Tax=Occultella gossypii TaxID=2800820 RepID=A0ABS7S6E4_9MICO|nr:hypothetical protein [Occultella gossypii]MBZ2195929.1 hypothetical protein [Occultella gossypii]
MSQTRIPGTRQPTVISPRGSWLGTGTGLGMAVGVALGNIVVDIAVGVAAGALLGIGLGIVLERADRRRRDREHLIAASATEAAAAGPGAAETAPNDPAPTRGVDVATSFTTAS